MTERARTVFLGTGAFAVPVLLALIEHPQIDLAAVVTAPQRPGSRGRLTDPPIAVTAAESGLNVLRPVRLRSAESVADVAALAPDLLVLADYGQIVPAALLELPPHGALNLHPSLLPRHRGATPIPAAILEGDAATGVTLMLMDAGLDTGPVIAQWRHDLSGTETAPELEQALADQAARLLTATTEPWLAHRIRPQPQADKGATLTRPLRRADGLMDSSRTATELERQVRAYQPWPGSFVETDHGRIVVWKARVDEPRRDQAIATLNEVQDGGLALVSSDALLVLEDVQPAGGRRMSGAELLRGRPGLAGATVSAPADAGT